MKATGIIVLILVIFGSSSSCRSMAGAALLQDYKIPNQNQQNKGRCRKSTDCFLK